MKKNYYPPNLTEKQWKVIENILNTKKRKRKHELRSCLKIIVISMDFTLNIASEIQIIATPPFGSWGANINAKKLDIV